MSQIPGWVGVMTEAIPRLREVNICLYQLVKIMNIAKYCNSLAYQMPGCQTRFEAQLMGEEGRYSPLAIPRLLEMSLVCDYLRGRM